MIPFNTNLTGVAEKRQPLFILSDLHHTGDRAAAGEFARDLALVQRDENLICIRAGQFQYTALTAAETLTKEPDFLFSLVFTVILSSTHQRRSCR